MKKEEILQKVRQENAGKPDEREMAALGNASRIGMLVGALLCVALVLASEFLFQIPEIGLAAWLVYFAMQGSSNLSLYRSLRTRTKLIWGIVELLFALAFLVTLVIKSVV